MDRFTKQTGASFVIAIEYVNRLPPGSTSISSGTVSAKKYDTDTTDNTVLASTTATISGTQARVKVQSGTTGEDYKITFLTTTSNGDILEDDVLMQVRDL